MHTAAIDHLQRLSSIFLPCPSVRPFAIGDARPWSTAQLFFGLYQFHKRRHETVECFRPIAILVTDLEIIVEHIENSNPRVPTQHVFGCIWNSRNRETGAC